LPDYIQRLDREEVLRGRNFAALNMQRPVPDRASPGAKAEASRTPHFLEFSLATAEPKSGSGVQASERAR